MTVQYVNRRTEVIYCDVCGADCRDGLGNGWTTIRRENSGEPRDLHLCHIRHRLGGNPASCSYSCEELYNKLNYLNLIAVPKERFK